MGVPDSRPPLSSSHRGSSMAELIAVVENQNDWKDSFPTIPIVSAQAYLNGLNEKPESGYRILNLTRNYEYLSIGYYISLLAEARGNRVLPSVRTLQDLSRKAIYVHDTSALEKLAQKTVGKARSDIIVNGIELMIYFGQVTSPGWQEFARQIFAAFPCPILRVELRRQQEWRLHRIRALHLHQLTHDQQQSFSAALADYLTRRWRKPRTRARYRYDLAILHNPDETLPPSNPAALKQLIKAGKGLGINVELITRKDYGRLAEYDALFIRETTRLDDHTYQFAKRADSEGMVVIDDPDSILRCTNKVYLAELLKEHRIRRPNTVIVSRETVKTLPEQLDFPMVLKIPDGSFSRGVAKAENLAELKHLSRLYLKDSDLILAQEYVYTAFDWRVGILDRQPLFACQYFMSPKHWQIVNHQTDGKPVEGAFRSWAVDSAPKTVVKTALRAANLIGDGFYGVDLKVIGHHVMVIEINDNPNLDAGIEDQTLGEAVYHRIMQSFIHRLERT